MRKVPENFEILDPEMVPVLQAMTGAERLAMANRMARDVRRMLAVYVAAENPGWSAEEVEREVAHRISHGAVEVAWRAQTPQR